MSDRMLPKLSRNSSVQAPITISPYSGYHSLNNNGNFII